MAHERVITRILDILISTLALLLLLPLMTMLAAMVYFDLGRPVIFQQSRPGFKGLSFRLYKFRTMTSVANHAHTSDNTNRITKLGALLRKTSLDELPELWNILKGDMSLVGPRPLLEEYLKIYTLEQLKRQTVKPGLTGWAQINGRNSIDWDKKLMLDIWYIDNASISLYFYILFLTIKPVLLGRGVNESGQKTMSKMEKKDE